MAVQCGRHICLGACVSNVKHMYTNAPGHIIDYIEFVWCIYTDIIISYAHEGCGICARAQSISQHVDAT